MTDDRLATWCVRHLDSAPVERFFGADHLSEVHGLRLADGRKVVLKLRGRQERLHGWRGSRARSRSSAHSRSPTTSRTCG